MKPFTAKFGARRPQSSTLLAAVMVFCAFSTGAVAKAPAEGIQVRGEWTVRIRSSSGELLRELKFENAVEPQGANYLVSLLKFGNDVTAAREDGGIPWSVNIGDPFGPDSLPGAIGVDLGTNSCLTILSNTPLLQASDPNYPQVTTEEDNGVSYLVIKRSLSLPASCLTAPTWSITSVNTKLSFTFTNSNSGSSSRFTRKIFDQPIAGIQPGQTVDLTVRISFE